MCFAESTHRQRAKLTTDVKEQKEELLHNVVLDLQVSVEQGVYCVDIVNCCFAAAYVVTMCKPKPFVA